jgi:hypothetical protein
MISPADHYLVLMLCTCTDGPVKKGRLTDSAGPTSKLFCIAAAHAGARPLTQQQLRQSSNLCGTRHMRMHPAA